MPRPTVAQLTYGSCTVVFTTLAMLLLSQTSSGPAVAVIAVAAVALGVLVAMTVPAPRRTPVIVARSAAEEPAGPAVPSVASVAAAAPEAVREPSAR
ncbi:hypothetical protein ABZ330_22885 [Streptomyces sp. NPDC006172]|uniref:hypothetical protein n=1 Tax=Streptomyces sp. NPDC006172 TaxID=3154470 RepID=UPI0033FB2512